jgi:hypothetical protein
VFLGFILRVGANRLTQGFGLFAIRVNEAEALSPISALLDASEQLSW